MIFLQFQNYHHEAECFWNIHVSNGNRIELNLMDVDLEYSSSCYYDYIEIFDGEATTDRKIGE